jgi:hypothetical protein
MCGGGAGDAGDVSSTLSPFGPATGPLGVTPDVAAIADPGNPADGHGNLLDGVAPVQDQTTIGLLTQPAQDPGAIIAGFTVVAIAGALNALTNTNVNTDLDPGNPNASNLGASSVSSDSGNAPSSGSSTSPGNNVGISDHAPDSSGGGNNNNQNAHLTDDTNDLTPVETPSVSPGTDQISGTQASNDAAARTNVRRKPAKERGRKKTILTNSQGLSGPQDAPFTLNMPALSAKTNLLAVQGSNGNPALPTNRRIGTLLGASE